MAINWIENGTVFSSSPSWYRRVGYEEIRRDATTVTIRVHLHLKLKGTSSSTFYGYPAYWDVNDGNNMQIKTSSRWYGGQDYRGFYTDIKVGANAGGGSGTFKVNMWSTSGGNADFVKTYTFNYSKWNTKPYWISGRKVTLRENNSGGRVISSSNNGTENVSKFPENVGAIFVDWAGQARDNENNPLTYELWYQTNEGAWSWLYTGTNTSYIHNIGSGAGTQGRSYDYSVKVKDSYGEWADGSCEGTQVQKNQLSQAMLNHSGNVGFDTTTINLSRTNASNTNGNGSFTYRLSSNDVTVYNGDNITGASIPVIIYKSGVVPTTPYIKWDDLKRHLAGNNYNRNLRFVLTTTNAYGSSATDHEDIWCDIRKNPTAFSFNTVSGTTVVNGKNYFLPSEKNFTMTWGTSIDPVGTQVRYDLYYAYNDVVWNLLASNLTSNTYTAKLPNVSKLTVLTFKVVAKTAYGTTTITEGGRTDLHYVGVPNIELNLTRNQLNYVVDGKVQINSSIPNLGLSSVKYRVGSSTADINATISGLTFKVTRNLAETSAESLTFYVLDRGNNDLGRPATTQGVLVSRYMPMFSIREKGVGVNTIPSGKAKLEVSGGASITGGLSVDGKNVLTDDSEYLKTSQLTSSGQTLGRIPQISGDGVMEIGRYLDFHSANSTTDYDGRIEFGSDSKFHITRDIMTTNLFTNTMALIGNDFKMNNKRALVGWANASDPLVLNYGGDFGGGIETHSKINVKATIGYDANKAPNNTSQIGIESNNNGLGIGLDQEFNSRNGWIQVGHSSNDYPTAYGTLRLNPKGGNVFVGNNLVIGGKHNGEYYGMCMGTDDGGWVRTTKAGIIPYQVGVSAQIGTGAWAFSEGNFRKILSPNGQNLDLVGRNGVIYVSVGSASGSALLIDRSWGGSKGSETCLRNSRGNGWNFIGNSGNAFYRIYGTGGSVSERARKYDIHKFDNQHLYDQIRELNTYGYRTISDEVDEDGNVISQLHRSDMQLGCMIDELPTEAVIYDEEGGNGKAVDIYAYCTMILGATKVIQDKIETLEIQAQKIDMLEQQVKVLAVQNQMLTNKNKELENKLEVIERILKENGIS